MIILIDCFQSFTHAVLAFCITLAELRIRGFVLVVAREPERGVLTGSFLVKDTRVPIHESSIRGFVRIYTYVFGGVVYELVSV